VKSTFRLADDSGIDDPPRVVEVVPRDLVTPGCGQHGWASVVKRAIDIVLASLVLAVIAPLVGATATLVRIETPGRAIFRQQRLGRGGRPFTMFKLRTMRSGNDDTDHRRYVAALMNGDGQRHGGMYKLTQDPRLTRLGRVLRRISLDEAPQLVNVIRGEMSLVGPRPPLPSEAELYDERDWRRLAVRPGITGLWQVSGRCELTYRDMIELDLRYVEQWSLWLDLHILAQTPRAVLSRRGAA
jgi:lipopolysaccharide/colanic/teichoic acid biosynthesis glycosyltransferase